jgi:hypothetical protein
VVIRDRFDQGVEAGHGRCRCHRLRRRCAG